MPRIKRACQFAPFDALKGLGDALRLKEYEVERVAKGEVSEEKAREISEVISSIRNRDTVKVDYFSDGHILSVVGSVTLLFESGVMEIRNDGKITVNIVDIVNIEKL